MKLSIWGFLLEKRRKKNKNLLIRLFDAPVDEETIRFLRKLHSFKLPANILDES